MDPTDAERARIEMIRGGKHAALGIKHDTDHWDSRSATSRRSMKAWKNMG
jgi:hypothetical protein